MHRPGTGPGPLHRPSDKGRGEGYGRPAILKPEDIQAMADNDEEEEGGWAGAQDEVDYAAKLDFEDFEEEEKLHAETSRGKFDREASSGEPETRWQSNEGRSVSNLMCPCYALKHCFIDTLCTVLGQSCQKTHKFSLINLFKKGHLTFSRTLLFQLNLQRRIVQVIDSLYSFSPVEKDLAVLTFPLKNSSKKFFFPLKILLKVASFFNVQGMFFF